MNNQNTAVKPTTAEELLSDEEVRDALSYVASMCDELAKNRAALVDRHVELGLVRLMVDRLAGLDELPEDEHEEHYGSPRLGNAEYDIYVGPRRSAQVPRGMYYVRLAGT